MLLGIAATTRGDADFPARSGRVVDEAGLLSQRARDRLTDLLEEHEQKTSNQVVVVTVTSLQGMSVESYALALANRWGVGTAERDNGVLLLVAPNERRVRIEVGIGLERNLTNRIADDIIKHRMLPAFRDGRHQAGIQEGVSGILAAIDNAYQFTGPGPERPWVRWIVILLILGAAVVIIVALARGVVDIGGTTYRSEDDRYGWRSDDDSWGSSRSSRSSRSSDRSSSGGSFRGGGASGRW